MSTQRRTALVTGASGGIGREFAEVLARHGHNLVLVARNGPALVEASAVLSAAYDVNVEVVVCDLSVTTAPRALFDTVQERGISVDILINNAGFGTYGNFTDTDWETEGAMIDLNVRALTELTKLFVRGMVGQGYGRIVNVASTAAFQPGPLMSVYYATKAYVLSFSEAIANELHGTGVTVTALCPGPTASGFQKTARIEHLPLVQERNLSTSREVAEYGYRAMKAGKTVAIHGVLNRILVIGSRLAPRSLSTAVVRMIQEKRR